MNSVNKYEKRAIIKFRNLLHLIAVSFRKCFENLNKYPADLKSFNEILKHRAMRPKCNIIVSSNES